MSVDPIPVEYGVERIEKDLGMDDARAMGLSLVDDFVEGANAKAVEHPVRKVEGDRETVQRRRELRGRLVRAGPSAAAQNTAAEGASLSGT